MPPDIKFCGLTRREDAQLAVRLGVRYLGVIFAGGPRTVTADAARAVLAGAPATSGRVGVFGTAGPDEVAAVARAVGLDVVQLHDDPDPANVSRVRALVGLPVWAAARVSGAELPARLAELFDAADAVVLDARVPGKLGGSGATFEWAGVQAALGRARGRGRLVLAGGLTAENVADAIRVLRPDVVDVSSGVESAPGIKSPARMRRFADAVRGVEVAV